jgi:hypothetical protein
MWELQRRAYYGRAPGALQERPWCWEPWVHAPRFQTRNEAIRHAMAEDLHPTDISEWPDDFVQHHWSKRSRFMGWRVHKITMKAQ